MAAQSKSPVTRSNDGARKRSTNKSVNHSATQSASADLANVQRAIADPQSAVPTALTTLQRLVGNRATRKLIQPKLKVGPAGDKYEQEADHIAREVMSAPTTSAPTPQEDEQALRMKPVIQRAATDAGFEAGREIESRLETLKGNGTPLPDPTRSKMESSFGADFSPVRVHTDGESAQLNRSLQAQAFTHGSDIYFDQGKYQPSNQSGQQLLAHELTHVVQQGAASTTAAVSRKAAEVRQGQVSDGRLQLARGKAGRVAGSVAATPLAVATTGILAPFMPLIGAGVGAYMAGKATYKKTGSKILAGLAGIAGFLGGAVAGALGAVLLPLASAIPGLMGGIASSMTFGSKGDRQKDEHDPGTVGNPYDITPIAIQGQDYVLRGRRYDPKQQGGPGAGKTVILFSGSGGPNENQLEPVASFYAKQGTVAYAINYRGFGKSRDKSKNWRGKDKESSPMMSEEGLVLDAVRIYEYVESQGVVAGNIILHGFSLGGAIAAKLAKRLATQGKRLGGLVLHSSIKTAYEAGKGGIGIPGVGHVAGLITKMSAGSFDTTQALEALHAQDPDIPIHFMSGKEGSGDQLALSETNLPESARGSGFTNVSEYEGKGGHLNEDLNIQTSEHLSPRQKGFLATLLNKGRGRDKDKSEEVNPR